MRMAIIITTTNAALPDFPLAKVLVILSNINMVWCVVCGSQEKNKDND